MLRVSLQSYRCPKPKCGGEVKAVRVGCSFRWTCQECQRDYGYNTDRPTFKGDFQFLTGEEIAECLKKIGSLK